jgi:hypothetical protein
MWKEIFYLRTEMYYLNKILNTKPFKKKKTDVFGALIQKTLIHSSAWW